MYYRVIFFLTRSGKSPVEELLHSIDRREAAKIYRDITLLTHQGLQLGMPHVKHLTGKLYELRTRGKQQIRLIFAQYDSEFIILHGFIKKSNRIPAKHLDTALARFSDHINR